MSWPRLGAIGVALLVSLCSTNVFGWAQGWSLLCGLSTLLVLHPISIGIERGLADKRDMEDLLKKLRDGENAD